jgi:hypothetical protein
MENKEKKDPRKICNQVLEREFPAWHIHLGQLQYSPIAARKKDSVQITLFETYMKCEIE